MLLAFEQVRLQCKAELVEVRRQVVPNVTSEQTSASNTTTVEQTLPTRSLLGGVFVGDASTGGGTGVQLLESQLQMLLEQILMHQSSSYISKLDLQLNWIL